MYNDIVCVTFSGTKIHRELQKEFTSLYKSCFHSIEEYTMEDVKESAFYFHNQEIFKQKKYSGYFLWKPYIILDTMNYYPDKLILYADSNIRFKLGKSWLEDFVNEELSTQDYFIIRHKNFTNKQYTKRDTFVLMNADNELYWNMNQCWTSFMAFDRSHLKILEKYRDYCTDERILTDIPNEYGENLDGFVAHRWEQSIMSILLQKYNLNNFVWDTEFIPHLIDKIYPEELMELKKNGF